MSIYIYNVTHIHTHCSAQIPVAKATNVCTVVPYISGFPFWRLKFSDRS